MEGPHGTYPLLSLKNTVVFPFTSLFLVVGRKKSIAALKMAQENDNIILVVAQKTQSTDPEEIDADNLHSIGTLCKIKNVVGSDKMAYQVLVKGLTKFHITKLQDRDHYLEASGEEIKEQMTEIDPSSQILCQNLKNMAKEILDLLPQAEESSQKFVDQLESEIEFVYLWSSYFNFSVIQKQEILEVPDVKDKIDLLTKLLQREREVLLLEKDIQGKIQNRLNQVQRRTLLREQMRIIKEELGEGDKEVTKDLLENIENAGMPEDVLKIAKEELTRLEGIHPTSSEYYVIRNYLDWLCAMPWKTSTSDIIDLEKAKAVLDGHHYGLQKIKRRILEHLAVVKLKEGLRGPILCLLGPPGVGKTSLGKSIAEALGRKFTRTALGGVKDESEIRGHRRTYVGAMPGRIIQGIKRVGVNNPLMLLDEIDKVGTSHHGDPSSAILEVLDPEQNHTFSDHYLDVPFDLSKVFFVATANRLDTIPAPLVDRMETIELSGYINEEKLHIAKTFILPGMIDETGTAKEQFHLDDERLMFLIERYTRESGVRELRRVIASVCRGVAYDVLHEVETPINVTEKKIAEYLGPVKYMNDPYSRTKVPGVVTGLAWTPFGGDVLFMECSKMSGQGKLHLTGQLGSVMKESAQIALSCMRSLIPQLNSDFIFEQHDIHIHIPAGAIPKDGPSAGITLLVALASLIAGKVVDGHLAMTGELTLTGLVLPVGGIKEKVIAAHRNKIEKIILPKQNEKDLSEVPEHIRKGMIFYLAENIRDVLNIAFEESMIP